MPAPDLPQLPPGLAAVAQVDPFDWHQPHTGNLWAVKRMLLDLLDRDHDAVKAHALGGLPWEEANGRTIARIQALAAAFLGRDPAFTTLPGWNAPGGIDAHLRAVFHMADGPPEKAVADALAKLVATGRGLMDAPPAETDQVAGTLRSCVEMMARALVGLPPVEHSGDEAAPWRKAGSPDAGGCP